MALPSRRLKGKKDVRARDVEDIMPFGGSTAMNATRLGVPGPDPIATRLKASRLDLLDLSLRNPLLNYRSSTRRGLDIIDEKSGQIFSFLLADGGSLRFHHTKTSTEAPQEGEVFYLDEASPGP